MDDEVDKKNSGEEISFEDIKSIEPQEKPFPYDRGAVSAGFRINMPKDVFDKIVGLAKSDSSSEICGVLAGIPYKDEDGCYVEVSDAIEGKYADSRTKQVTFTHKTWQYINREMDERHPDKVIVGWFHSHPGYGPFLSKDDIFIYKHYFNAPWQVSFVVDAVSGQERFFCWAEGGTIIADTARLWIDGELVDAEADGKKAAADYEEAIIAISRQVGQVKSRVLMLFLFQLFFFLILILLIIANVLMRG